MENHFQDITSEADRSLDSSHASVSAQGANSEPRYDEGIEIVPSPESTDWYYLLLRSKELRLFSDLLSGKKPLYIRTLGIVRRYTFRFTTYTYTATDHLLRMRDYHYTEDEYQKRKIAAHQARTGIDSPTGGDLTAPSSESRGGGYLFVRGSLKQIGEVLEMITPRRYLVSDLATRRAAAIPARQMKDFIMVYEMAPWSLRFVDRPIKDYARTHELIRITGGVLEGAQGYIVRINKDRKLVLSLGNMTLAVSGIHSFPFEPVTERPRSQEFPRLPRRRIHQ